jgi:hypothetical protein
MTTIYVKDKDKLPKRHKNDLYQTETTLIEAALKHFCGWYHYSSILDIGAGVDGRWGAIAKKLNGNDRTSLTGIEIEPCKKPKDYDNWVISSFSDWEPPQLYELILSNPPYNKAEEFIRKAWECLENGGNMIMLLRLAFQASVKRYEGLWTDLPPTVVGVLSRRPSFYGGGTNGTDYAIYVWDKDLSGNPVGTPRTWQVELLMYEREDTKGNYKE